MFRPLKKYPSCDTVPLKQEASWDIKWLWLESQSCGHYIFTVKARSNFNVCKGTFGRRMVTEGQAYFNVVEFAPTSLHPHYFI
jgi:hypothetical protein